MEFSEIQKEIQIIADIARKKGLVFGDVDYEHISREIMVELAAYVLPNRFNHWTFGRDYDKYKKYHELGLMEILEMVVNTLPARAYLLDSNTPMDHKMVIAHVYAHVDFFQNNYWFSKTNRNILGDEKHYEKRVKELTFEHGLTAVEEFLDILLSIQWNVDFYHQFSTAEEKEDESLNERDLLLFLSREGRLDSWQKELLEMVREESLYFYPNTHTKIMNEGWATYWHSNIMEEYLPVDEYNQFAIKQSQLMASQGLNPYKLGFLMWEDIRKRWDEELGEDEGLKKMFQVRSFEDDVSFVRNYLTQDICDRCGFFIYEKNPRTGQLEVTSTDVEQVKSHIITSISNLGKPIIRVVDSDFNNNSELLLKHQHDGRDLDLDYTKDVMKNVARLWKRPVNLYTVLKGEQYVLRWADDDLTAETRKLED